jgi:hypothetical protein
MKYSEPEKEWQHEIEYREQVYKLLVLGVSQSQIEKMVGREVDWTKFNVNVVQMMREQEEQQKKQATEPTTVPTTIYMEVPEVFADHFNYATNSFLAIAERMERLMVRAFILVGSVLVGGLFVFCLSWMYSWLGN